MHACTHAHIAPRIFEEGASEIQLLGGGQIAQAKEGGRRREARQQGYRAAEQEGVLGGAPGEAEDRAHLRHVQGRVLFLQRSHTHMAIKHNHVFVIHA